MTTDQFGEEHMLGSTTFSRCSMDLKAEDIGENGDGKRNSKSQKINSSIKSYIEIFP